MEPESFYETMMYQGITIEHKLQIDNPLFYNLLKKNWKVIVARGQGLQRRLSVSTT